MLDIHNEYLLGWLQANENNPFVKKFKAELDKSVADTEYWDDYYDYLEDNIGDDASFTVSELEKIKKGNLVVKYNEADGQLHLYEYSTIKVIKRGDYLYCLDDGRKKASFSFKTDKMYGDTQYFKYIDEHLKRIGYR